MRLSDGSESPPEKRFKLLDSTFVSQPALEWFKTLSQLIRNIDRNLCYGSSGHERGNFDYKSSFFDGDSLRASVKLEKRLL
jgi:hypothetical protein